MARRRTSERYIAGAYAIGALPLNVAIKPALTPVRVAPVAVQSLVTAHPAASITAFTPKTTNAAAAAGLTALSSTPGFAGLVAAANQALKPPATAPAGISTGNLNVSNPALNQALAAAANPAAVAQATASANKLISAGQKVASKKGASKLAAAAQAAGRAHLANVSKAQSLSAAQVASLKQAAKTAVLGHWIGAMNNRINPAAGGGGSSAGSGLGVPAGASAPAASGSFNFSSNQVIDFSSWYASQAGADDALAEMVEAGGSCSDLISTLTAAGQTSTASQGQTIYNAMLALLTTAGVSQASIDANNITATTGNYTSISNQANSLTNQEMNWETTAAPLAGTTAWYNTPPASSTGGTTTPGAPPTITAVSDVSNPTGNTPPNPYASQYGATGGANPGDQVSITGTNLTGATSVMFSGVPALSFQVVSATQINATVPQGAPSGPVMVATPGGTATSTGVIYMNPAASMYGQTPYGDTGAYGGGGAYGSDGGGLDDSDIDWGDGSDQGDGGGDDGMDFGDGGGGGGGGDYDPSNPPDPTNPGFLMDGSPDPSYGGGGGDASAPDTGYGGSGEMSDSDIDWDDSSQGDSVVGENRYVVGAQVIGADWDEILGDAVPHAPFDNRQIYNPGDIVSYWGQWWKATRQVVPPLVPSIMKGDVPGGNDAWVPLTAEEVITDVLSGVDTIPTAGAKYTDKQTVAGVQTALNAHGFGPLTVDGIMGPKTSAAITAAQIAASIPPTGVIDEGVIAMLGVTPGVLPPGVTLQQKAALEAQVALDAATAVEHAATQPDVQAAAAQVVAAAPAEPPELKQAAVAAHAAAVSATTPAQIAAAKQQVQAVAQKVVAQVAPGWWGTPLWDGAPVKRWQGVVAGGAAIFAGVGLALVARRR